MFLIYTFLTLLFLGFITYLIQKIKKDKKYNRKFYDFEENTTVVVAVLALIVVFFLVNFFVEEPKFSSANEKLEYGKKTNQPWLESSVYREMLEKDSLDVDLNYNLIKTHFDNNQNLGPNVKNFNQEAVFIRKHFERWASSNSSIRTDLGELFLAIYYYYRGDNVLCKSHLENVKDKNLKYYNTYAGYIAHYYNEPITSEKLLLKEISLDGDLEGAYDFLVGIYDYHKDYDKIFPYVYNPKSKFFIPYDIKQRIHITHYDFKNYFVTLFSAIFKNTNLIGFIGAFLILLVWIFYLVRISFNKNVLNIIATIFLSCVLMVPVWMLYDIYKYLFDFDLNGKVLNDLLYCIFGIGFIEELIKIIPFLIVLKFTKVVKKPIDYIFYASLSALGFAFIENFKYFEDGSLHIMHSRALTASISHMVDSSIIAYGLILAKFRYKKNTLLFGFTFFIIAAFAHGFYDFWLLNKEVSGFGIFTFLCLLTEILVYASIINNSLNHSFNSQDSLKLNTPKIASDLAAGLIAIFLFEYICLTFIFGPTIGNRELISSTLSGGYLILFLSIRLSNIDIIPNDWAKIDFFVGLLPMQIVYGDKKPNYNSLIGKFINIKLFRKKGILENILPLDGEIIKREKISGFTGWFLVKLNKPIFLNKTSQEFILIRAKEKFSLIRKGDDTIISFAIPRSPKSLELENKTMKDFIFVDWAIGN